MGVDYRLAGDDDAGELVRLWEDHTDWGAPNLDRLTRLLRESPAGKATIVVAEDRDAGSIVGQFAFLPTLISVGGRRVRAVRPAAPIFDTGSARFGSRHPLWSMYRYGLKELARRGVGLAYLLTGESRWAGMLRLLPSVQVGKLESWRLRPVDGTPLLPAGFSAARLSASDHRVDSLWEAASSVYPCFVARDAESLQWKLNVANLEAIAVERGGELRGIATLGRQERHWWIVDLIAADREESQAAALAAACDIATAESGTERGSPDAVEISALGAATLVDSLRALGFRPTGKESILAVQVLDSTIDRADVAPDRWHVGIYG